MLSGFLRAFDDGRDPTVINLTRNQDVARRNAALGVNWADANRATTGDLARFRSGWEGSADTRSARAGEEASSLNRYFDGGFLRDLSDIRARARAARTAAAEQNISRGMAADSSNALLSGGGGNAYRDRLRARLVNENLINAALADSDQERSDYLTADQMRNAAIGRRNAITEADLASIMTPTNISLAALGQLLSQAGGVNQQVHDNSFYGLRQERTGLGKAADILGALEGGVMDAASIYSGVAGGGGGGGGGGV